RSERIEIPLVPLLCAGVLIWATDEADPAKIVRLDQMADRVEHAVPVVHQQAGRAGEHLLDADDRQRLEPAAELVEPFGADEEAERRRPDDQAVEPLRVDEVVDRVRLRAEPARVLELPAD